MEAIFGWWVEWECRGLVGLSVGSLRGLGGSDVGFDVLW
jgi:hypothetical protein